MQNITTQDAAERLGVSVRRVQALITAGRLPALQIGSGKRSIYLIDPKDLALVANRKPGRPVGSKNADHGKNGKPPRKAGKRARDKGG